MNLPNRNRITDVENKFMVTRREKGGQDKLGDWDQQIQTTIYKMDNQQEPMV